MERTVRAFVSCMVAALAALSLAGPSIAAAATQGEAVSFFDSQHGYIAGSWGSGLGFVSSTSDGGSTWKTTQLNRSMVGVSAASATNAWASPSFDNAAFKTTDGGSTWPRVEPVGAGAGYNFADVASTPGGSVVMVGAHLGTVSGDLAAIWTSQNGGVTWSKGYEGPVYSAPEGSTEPPSTNARIQAVDFAPDGQTGWAVGTELKQLGGNQSFPTFSRVLVFKTSDGGKTWDPQSVTASSAAVDVSAVNATTAWLVCGLGQTFRTTNGGTTWVATASKPSGISPYAASAIDESTIVIVGDKGKIARTNNAGASWTYPTSALPVTLRAIDMVSSTVGYASGTSSSYMKTTNGGVTWAAHALFKETRTSLTISAAPYSPSFGRPASVRGYLRTSSGAALAGRMVTIESSTDRVHWKYNTQATTTSSGSYSAPVVCTQRTWLRARFAGNGPYLASASRTIDVRPRAYLTTPVAPSTMSRLRSYTVYGYLKPRHSGNAVTLYAYRYERGTWRLRVTASARVSNYQNYSKYAARVRLPSAGKWRIRAYHYDSGHYPTYSGYRNVTVR